MLVGMQSLLNDCLYFLEGPGPASEVLLNWYGWLENESDSESLPVVAVSLLSLTGTLKAHSHAHLIPD